MNLKLSQALTVAPPSSDARKNPLFFDADRIANLADGTVEASGDVIARTLGESFRADWLRYDPKLDEVHAKGNVLLQQNGNRLESHELKLRLSDHLGEVKTARFSFPREDGRIGRGEADVLLLRGRDRYRMETTTYTTCPVGNDDWQLRMDKLDLDYIDKVGQARDVKVEYLGMPILYAPWLDFALDNSRKTGFLSPTVGVSDDRGFEAMVPWYWNIAPNRDATLMPRLMSRRGLQVGGEFRYLEPDYRGELAVEALPSDNLTGEGRYRGYLDHQHRFSNQLSGRVLLENVSDDDYFRDLSNLVNQTSRVHLPREASLLYTGDGWSARGLMQAYQTLQDPLQPITEPYRRLPQVMVNADRDHLLGGFGHFKLDSEFVRFDHDLASKAVGNRFYVYPRIEASYERPYAYIRPKFGWHFTMYDLDRNPDPLTSAPRDTNLTRSLPVFSLDAGGYLERDWQFGASQYLQTLEPRLYYVKIPGKDQADLPVFDSSVADLSYSQLFSENQFIGVDRINDANQLTLAVTSRLIEPGTGLERLQVTLGQRYYFNDQQVTMPGYVARGTDITDILAQVSGQITDRWRLDSGFQYNPDDGQLARANFGATYRAGPGKLVNADLRYINEDYGAGLNQFDLSWQWPVKPGWHALGRLNYSFQDDRLVEGLLGFEYNAGCWSLRAVMQKLATSTGDSTNAFFLQLELQGLTQLGPNPLEVLKRSISGYTKSDEFNLP